MNRTSFKRRLVWTGRDTEPALTVLSADDLRLFSLSDPCPISAMKREHLFLFWDEKATRNC